MGFILRVLITLLCGLVRRGFASSTTAYDYVWVVAEYRESHAEACLRLDLTATETYVELPNSWDVTVLNELASGLTFNVTDPPIQSCCVASMWCTSSNDCYTSSYGKYFVNQGWKATSPDRPVFTCQSGKGNVPSISHMSVDVISKIATIKGSNLGTNNDDVVVSIMGDTCTATDICSSACKRCDSSSTCNDDQVCLSHGNGYAYCYTFCGGPQDVACPCGYTCEPVTVVQTYGTTQRSIETNLCAPKSFSEGGSKGPCQGYTGESLHCVAPDYTSLAMSGGVTVSLSVNDVNNEASVALDTVVLALQCSHDSDCEDMNVCTIDTCTRVGDTAVCMHATRAECSSQELSTVLRSRAFTYASVILSSRQASQDAFTNRMLTEGKDSDLSQRDDFPLLHVVLDRSFPFFGNYYSDFWLNPNALIQLPPHTSCADLYASVSCITYSTETNTISIYGNDWDPSNSNAAHVYTLFPESGSDLLHVLFKDVKPYSENPGSEINTFSSSIFSDGSVINRYHSLQTAPTAANQFSLWGARLESTQYHEENLALDVIKDGVDAVFCPVSTLGCIRSACLGPGEMIRVNWSGISCEALGKNYTINYECSFLGGVVTTPATLSTGLLSCVVPQLSLNSSTVIPFGIRWSVSGDNVTVNYASDGSKDIIAMAYDNKTSTAMYTNLMIRYNLGGDKTTCGCSPLAGLEAAQCDDCLVCNGVNSTVDCAGTCHGSAAIDECGECSGGTTGEHPGASCEGGGSGVPNDQLAIISQSIVLITLMCCMTFTFTSCIWVIRSAVQGRDHHMPYDGAPPRRGLSADEIQRLPLVQYRAEGAAQARTETSGETSTTRRDSSDVESSLVEMADVGSAQGQHSECAICLSEFVEGDQCRRLPCMHIFHVSCIDAWLDMSVVCPLCKRDIREHVDY